MGIAHGKLIHRIVYWPPTVAGGSGQPTYGEPVEMAGRWVPKETQIITPEGSKITVQTVVWTEEPVLKNGFLFKGTLDEVVNTTVPVKNPGARRIAEYAERPTVDGTDQINIAYL